MFKFLAGLLGDPAPHPDPLTADDAEMALAALLVRLARSDDHYGDAERAHIERVLAMRAGLSPAEAQTLRMEAETVEAEAPDTVRFTRALKDKIAYEDRIGVIEAMWQVALADNARAPEEDALIRLAANLLGVSDRDSGLARKRVAAQRG
ncbi:TerB family tellurite resistance protein [Rhodobacter lacus]|uniref:TerB family tellurite resistance protein n=1 Tax=Rhodobacter lacus TaxID=1641972 RepID=A0ABW5A857_9RHOB